MKRISSALLFSIALAFILISSTGFAAVDINPTTDFYVNDYASVLTESTKSIIMQSSVELQSKTGAQIVVVTVNSLGNNVLEDYTLNILRSWGIGDKVKNNGVLIFLSVGDRKSRIEVGYGLEGILPDGKTGRIQDDYIIPYYSQGNFDEGIKNGYAAILKEVVSEYNVSINNQIQPPATVNTSNNPISNMSPITKIIIGIIVTILLLIDWIFFHGTITRTLFWIFLLFFRRGGGKGFRGGGFGGGGGGFSGGGGIGGGGGSSRGF